ncbi:MAG TPA: 8-oxo-dGTP diphosphatase [Candidatus Paceibacterota bacterium]|nr:8-oxo-dGTP diphosphatase [Candidatus Paceibacterota bacterium]
MKQATIVYCLKDDQVLLGMKKARFGQGKWNGFGGKVGEGESVIAAAVRELKEEAGISMNESDLSKVAQIAFYFADAPIFECHVFLARTFSGEPIESEEMRPQWHSLNALPFAEMWPSDLYWLPAVLAGHTLKATCTFDAEGKIVERFEAERSSF